MATKLPSFLLLLLVLAFQETTIMLGQALSCEAPSKLYTGLCIIGNKNCGAICSKEGFVDGRCKLFKCVCIKNCNGGVPPGQGPPTGGPPDQGPPTVGPPDQGAPGDGAPPAEGSPGEGGPPGEVAPGDGGPPAEGAPGDGGPPGDVAPGDGGPPTEGAPGDDETPAKGPSAGKKKPPHVLNRKAMALES